MSVAIAFIYFTCVFLFVFIVPAVIKSEPTATLRSGRQHGTTWAPGSMYMGGGKYSFGVLDLWIITWGLICGLYSEDYKRPVVLWITTSLLHSWEELNQPQPLVRIRLTHTDFFWTPRPCLLFLHLCPSIMSCHLMLSSSLLCVWHISVALI